MRPNRWLPPAFGLLVMLLLSVSCNCAAATVAGRDGGDQQDNGVATSVQDAANRDTAGSLGRSDNGDAVNDDASDAEDVDDDADDDDSGNSDELYDIGSVEVPHPERAFAAFREQYISKEGAERLRQLIAARPQPLSAADYDQLLAQVVEPRRPANPPMVHKKYFDYLPADDRQRAEQLELEPLDVHFEPLVDDLDLEAEAEAEEVSSESRVLMEPAPQLPDDEVVAVNRAKRDLYNDHHQRFYDAERRAFNAQFEHNWRATQLRAQQLAAEASQWAASPFNAGNPWSSGFFRQGPQNVYLPPAPIDMGYFYPRPQVPFVINRVPGGHNVPQPPHNPPSVRPLPQAPESPPVPGGSETEAPTTDLHMRIGDDDDDRPVWGASPISNTIPGSANTPAVPRNNPARPTVETPPLLHNSDFEDYIPPRPQAAQAAAAGQPQQQSPPVPSGVRPGAFGTRNPTVTRPVPDLLHNSDDPSLQAPPRPQSMPPPVRPLSGIGSGRDGNFGSSAPVWSVGRIPDSTVIVQNPRFGNSFGGGGGSSSSSGRRPAGSGSFAGFPPPPTPAPRVPAAVAGPTYCVWAIVDCCAHRNRGQRQACFERIGCSGSIWDVDPCSDAVVDAAIGEADQFFN